MQSEQGELELAIPRDRQGTFEPVLVPKHQRRLSGLDEKILALYARGMSTRDIALQLEELYGEQLQQLGLQISELDEKGVKKALEFRGQEPALSLPDSFALALAHKHNWVLLTGDRALRTLAVQECVKCHGALWVIDQIHQLQVVNPQVLRESLIRISRHPRCRLPKYRDEEQN